MSTRPRDEHPPTRPRDEQPLAGFGPTRVFRAASMREAFVNVKAAIGPEAVILTTRDLGREGGSDDQRFEVVAAWPSATTASSIEARAHGQPFGPSAGPRGQRDATIPDAMRIDARAPRAEASEAQLTTQLRQLEQAVRGLESQIQLLGEKDRRMRDELGRLGQAKALLEEGGPTAALMAAGLEREVATELVERAVRRATPRQGVAVARHPDLAGEILRTVKVSPPLWALPPGSIAALIGPSGSGKTTSLLKLAGLATFAHRKDVAIISTDLERLGAFESLMLYAEVMGVPAVAARDRAEVDAALERFADRDLVLMDTAGHNPFDASQRYLALKPVSGREVRQHLVLPATLSPGLVGDMLAAYDGPALESLIVTRLDEARGPSAVLAACLRAELPVSHLAAGREIPDDIRAVDPHEVARDLLEKGIVMRASHHEKGLRVIAVASGKGGVGKTQVAVNLAVELAARGERVLIIDGDVGTCNAHMLLDVSPRAGLGDVACGLIAVEDALCETPHGPTLLSGRASHARAADGLDDHQALTLLAALDSIGPLFDVVVIDTAPGVGSNALFFAGAAEEVLLVTTPEPTALADTYASARALLRRSCRTSIGLVVNQALSFDIAHAVHHRLRTLVRQFLGADVTLLGWIPFDPMVHDAVMRQTPFVTADPETPASRGMQALAKRLADLPASTEGSGDLRFFWSTLHCATR